MLAGSSVEAATRVGSPRINVWHHVCVVLIGVTTIASYAIALDEGLYSETTFTP